MPQKPVKKSHFEGIKELDKINNYLVDMDRDMFNFYQYFVNFPKVYRQDALPTIPTDSIALWDDTISGRFYWVVNINGTQKTLDFAASSSSSVDHSTLNNLEYIHAGHTGFEPTVTKGDLTGGSPISIAGGVGSVIGAGTYVAIAQADTSTDGYVSSTDWGIFNAKTDYLFGANNFSGTGNFITDGNVKGKGFSYNVTIVSATSANYNATSSDDLIQLQGTTTCNLPASTGSGKSYYIKNAFTTGNALITANGGTEYIDEESSQILYANEGIHVIDMTAHYWEVL